MHPWNWNRAGQRLAKNSFIAKAEEELSIPGIDIGIDNCQLEHAIEYGILLLIPVVAASYAIVHCTLYTVHCLRTSTRVL